MVDPDNRRPVDYAARARLLAEIDSASNPDRGSQLAEWLREWPDGRIKLAVTRALLRHRADFAEPLPGRRVINRSRPADHAPSNWAPTCGITPITPR